MAVTSTTSLSFEATTVTSFFTSSGDMSTLRAFSSRDVATWTRSEPTICTLSAARLSASGAPGRSPIACSSGPMVWRNSSLEVDS